MLYHLFDWLNREGIKFPGSGLFEFITFRVLLAVLLSLFITTFYGKKLIRFLQKKQIGESIREEGLPGEESKKGTPTMGGIIIIMAIIIPTLLLANLTKIYVQLMLVSTVWMGIIGFIDDYLKLRGKKLAKQKGEQYKKTSQYQTGQILPMVLMDWRRGLLPSSEPCLEYLRMQAVTWCLLIISTSCIYQTLASCPFLLPP